MGENTDAKPDPNEILRYPVVQIETVVPGYAATLLKTGQVAGECINAEIQKQLERGSSHCSAGDRATS